MSTGPSLAATYTGSDPCLLERIAPLIDYLEVSPESFACRSGRTHLLRPDALAELAAVSPPLKLLAHGEGLSLGSFDSWNDSYLHLLDQFFNRFSPEWYSEHLAYTTVAGESLGRMATLPRTHETLDLVCTRIQRLQERYAVPFLLEPVIGLLPGSPSEFTSAGFLNAITGRTGCGLILDAYSLECDRRNNEFDIRTFLEELNLKPVRELHVSGGIEHRSFQLDVRCGPISSLTLLLALDLIARCPNLQVVTYEFFPEAVPAFGREGFCAELSRIRIAISQ